MNKLKYLLLIIFMISGCSTIKPLQYHNKNTSSRSQTSNKIPDEVDLNLNNQPVIPVDKSTVIIPQEETVRIGDSGGDVYASNVQPTVGESGENKKLKIA